MRKRYFAVLITIILILTSCNKSSDQFLSYLDVNSSVGFDIGNQLSEKDFFAKELVIIPEEEDAGDNDLISAKAALLINVTDNKLLYSKNVYERLYPASLTKLVTALVVLKRGELTDSITVSHNASHISDPGAKTCGLKEGDVISLETLLKSLLVYSGNDAGIAIAEHVGGSEEQFVKLMNEEAKQIGAVHSNFVNSHGLHNEDHYTTAYDIYLIFHELIQYDTFRSIININSYTAIYYDKDGNPKEKTFPTTNLFLSGEKELPETLSMIGGKSGTTSKAGNCLILLTKDEEENYYISLILKASSQEELYSDMLQLFAGIGDSSYSLY